MENQVPVTSMAGMLFSLIVSVGLPIVLCMVIRIRTKAKFSSFLIGCGTFFISAMVLEQTLHVIVLNAAGDILRGNIWIYGLYGGVAAAVFEETGRFLAMKYFMKRISGCENALMYGAGHGGIEAALIVGLVSVNNLVTSFMINTGQINQVLSALDENTRNMTMQQISALWELPGWQFYMAGVERILAVGLQIALSVLVYYAVKSGDKRYFMLALFCHFFVDFITVVAASFVSVAVVECLVAVMSAAVGGIAWKVSLNEKGAIERI